MSNEQKEYPMQPPVDTDKAYPPPDQYSQQAQYPPQYSQQPVQNVVVRQSQVQPNDYLALAIFVTICCCLPLGIVGIVKASEVRNRYVSGDYQGALDASNQAKTWSIAGLVCGLVTIGLVVLLYVVFGVILVAAAAGAATTLDETHFNTFDLANHQ